MLLKDFYRNTVDLNDTEKGGWATFYYGVFSKIINENNYKNVAEVGIGYGTHAKQILKNTNIDKLYLIDPMKFYPNDGFATDIMNQISESGNNFDEMYQLINTELAEWKDKYVWFRNNSLDITNEQIPNNSLDCVFVDGDHSYNAIKQDLRFWWNKVRVGGQMLGDDYWMDDVSKAVNEFALEMNIECQFLFREETNYKIFRFIK